MKVITARIRLDVVRERVGFNEYRARMSVFLTKFLQSSEIGGRTRYHRLDQMRR